MTTHHQVLYSDELKRDHWNRYFRQHSDDRDYIIAYYNQYADDYDQGMEDELYNGTKLMAQLVYEQYHDKPDASLLFVPSGTGNEIAELQRLGNGRFTNITGYDGSQHMLDILKKKNISKHQICGFFERNCGLPSNSYDALVCVGGFVPGHLKVNDLEEMCRVIKPGGLVMIMMREEYLHDNPEYNNGKLTNEVDRMADAGMWRKVCLESVPNYYGDMPGKKFVLRKTSSI